MSVDTGPLMSDAVHWVSDVDTMQGHDQPLQLNGVLKTNNKGG